MISILFVAAAVGTVFDSPIAVDRRRAATSLKSIDDEAWGYVRLFIGDACTRASVSWNELPSMILGAFYPGSYTIELNIRDRDRLLSQHGVNTLIHEHFHACGSCYSSPLLSVWQRDVDTTVAPTCLNYHLNVGGGRARNGLQLTSEIMTPVISPNVWISAVSINTMPYENTLCDPNAGACDASNPEKKCSRPRSTLPYVCGGPVAVATAQEVSDITIGCSAAAGVLAVGAAIITTNAMFF